MQSCRYGHNKSAAYLIKNKANLNAINIMGLNALSLAIYGGFNKVCCYCFQFCNFFRLVEDKAIGGVNHFFLLKLTLTFF